MNVMKQSGCEVPAWMNDLPKLRKQDKRRIKQNMVKREEIGSDSKVEKRRKVYKRYPLDDPLLM